MGYIVVITPFTNPFSNFVGHPSLIFCFLFSVFLVASKKLGMEPYRQGKCDSICPRPCLLVEGFSMKPENIFI